MATPKPNIKVLKLFDDATLPAYQSMGASGADVSARLLSPVTIPPMGRAAIPTGLKFDIPSGYEIQVRPRSGLAINYGITVLNTPGTIDSDYRGELKIILINLSGAPFIINNGDRIAQLVVTPVVQADFSFTDKISASIRGERGFGSTGVASNP